MTPQEYAQGLFGRLEADGCAPRWESAATPVLFARRADFKLRWMGTRLHLFTIAAIVPFVDSDALSAFTDYALQAAIERKGGLVRGAQTGVAVFPTLISDRVEPSAARQAARSQALRWACMGRPTVVDTTTGTVSAYRGTPLVGLLYAGYLRKKNKQYFPRPWSDESADQSGGAAGM